MSTDAFAQAKGYPPLAAKTVCIDFDGTIVPWGPLNGNRPPFRGVKDALLALKARGYRIIILTSRLSDQWWEAEAAARDADPWDFSEEQTRFLVAYLARWGLPYDEVTAEKVPALVYFDDRAVHVERADNALAAAITVFLTGEP